MEHPVVEIHPGQLQPPGRVQNARLKAGRALPLLSRAGRGGDSHYRKHNCPYAAKWLPPRLPPAPERELSHLLKDDQALTRLSNPTPRFCEPWRPTRYVIGYGLLPRQNEMVEA